MLPVEQQVDAGFAKNHAANLSRRPTFHSINPSNHVGVKTRVNNIACYADGVPSFAVNIVACDHYTSQGVAWLGGRQASHPPIRQYEFANARIVFNERLLQSEFKRGEWLIGFGRAQELSRR